VKRIGQEGDIGIVHKSRGKEFRRNLPEEFTECVVFLYHQKYNGKRTDRRHNAYALSGQEAKVQTDKRSS